MLNTHCFLILHSMPYYSPCLFSKCCFELMELFLSSSFYQKQRLIFFTVHGRSILGDAVDTLWLPFSHNCLWPIRFSSRPVRTANVAVILHFEPHLPNTPTPPPYLCLVSREKIKAPYVLVLENTWINVLFLCKKKSSTFCHFSDLIKSQINESVPLHTIFHILGH